MVSRTGLLLAAAAALPFSLAAASLAQGGPAPGDPSLPSVTGEMPPKTWVDKDTGHRVWRVSDEPNSGAFYFNVNAFTPDGKQMVYNSPSGIMALDLATMKSKLLVANPPRPAGRRSRRTRRLWHGCARDRSGAQDKQHFLYEDTIRLLG